MDPVPRTLIADDHRLVADALNELLAEHCEMVGTVLDGSSLLAVALERRPDLISADLSMPGLSGVEAVGELRRAGVMAKIIIVSMYGDPRVAKQAIAAGASGFVAKQGAGEELLTAIRVVLKGGSYISPHIAERMASAAATERPLATLTPRQREILQFIAKGHSAKEIAAALNLSPRTVETHKYEIMRALGFRKSADLVRYATSMGLGMS
jgi:DNA-binding NarL/FixJ family response regulator